MEAMYVINAKGEQEELSLGQINFQLREGTLTGKEPAWQPGMAEWAPLETIPGVGCLVNSGPAETPVRSSRPFFRRRREYDHPPIGFRGWYRRVMGVIMFFVGLVMIASDGWFLLNADHTSGTMTGSPKRYDVGTPVVICSFYRVDYTYVVEGKKYAGVSSINYSPASISLDIYYDRRDPRYARIGIPNVGYGFGIFFVGLCSVTFFFIRPWEWWAREE